MGQRVKELEARLSLLESSSVDRERVASSFEEVYKNQVELAGSADRVDDQFAVLTRLVILKLNEVVQAVNLLRRAHLDSRTDIGLPPNPVTYGDVNSMFAQYELLKQRRDFRQLAEAWYMGQDLSNLPPPPEEPQSEELSKVFAEADAVADAAAKEAAEDPSLIEGPDSVGFPDGAQIFGGDFTPQQDVEQV